MGERKGRLDWNKSCPRWYSCSLPGKLCLISKLKNEAYEHLLRARTQVFGPPPKSGHATSSLPQHGFARASRWEFLGKSTVEDALESDSVKLDFGLDRQGLSDEARKAWPLDFGLVYSVTLSKDKLQTVITVRNEGDESFEFQFLLHTYFRIQVRCTSLGSTYNHC